MSQQMKAPCLRAVSRLTAAGFEQDEVICVYRFGKTQSFLGRGGAGRVVRREYKKGMPVAVKAMEAGTSADAVKKEVDMMKLMGEHTAGLLGVTMTRSGVQFMIVMRCAEHGDLRQFMKAHQAQFVWALRKRMGLDVARGLMHLHGMGIYHEDVKSQNVLIDANLRAKLSDFGCSRRIGEAHPMGISYNAAPEKMQHYDGEGDEYEIGLSDIYSYGTVLWEMGYLDEFDAKCIEHSGDVPSEYASIVTACVSEHPSHRPSLEWIISTLSLMQEAYEADGSIVPSARIEMDVDEFARTVTSMSIKVIINLAQNGEVNSQMTLGNAYLFGHEVEQNDAEAFKWFMRAAQQNEPRAQFNVGSMYEKGQGVEQDIKRAFEWMMKAAGACCINKQCYICWMCEWLRA